ncbi:hypothetical protein TWF481_009172 [Arthrobotrys musiformis]|uniref:Uncharacterized protein n=1 Tax=Arthrobotrys musiformis TaxID=47236 RepID=A0AAV9W2Y1_9PEZI
MKFLPLAVSIWAAVAAAVPPARRSAGGKKDPAILDFEALRLDKPQGSTNQYYKWYDNIFEDHWGDRFDIGYTQFVEEMLRKGWEGGEIYRQGQTCRERVTPVDSDPDYTKAPLDRIVASPIFCHRGIMILVQYNPELATPPGAKEERQIPCKSYAFRAYELAAAIDNKYRGADGGVFDPMFRGRKAIPNAPDNLVGKVYNPVVTFQWETFTEVNLQIVGRTRWSEDQSEWIILAILEGGVETCPFRVDTSTPPPKELPPV